MSQPTEQIDALEIEDDDEYGPVDEEHAEHAPGAYDTGEPHGPYYG